MSVGDSNPFHLELECAAGREYDEGAFRYLLRVECSRADRSNRAPQLLLVSIEPVLDSPSPIGKATAHRVFAGLTASVRETDVIGWYRQDRVAGVVLSAHLDPPGSGSREIEQRVGNEIQQRLPSGVARTLRVRLVHLRPSAGHL